jgi:hypothetical protein
MPMNNRLLRPRESNRLLLDIYSGAAAAYSLRKIRSGHSTGVVRVRRSSDSAEDDFTATQITNGALASWVGSGNNGLVVTWYDQSGNGRHATQATAANQPTLVSSGAVVLEGSKPAIDFDGSSTRLIHSGSAISALSTVSQFAVSKTRGTTVSHFIASVGQNVAGEGSGLIYTSSEEPRLFIWGVANEATGSSNTTSRVLLSSVANGTALSLWINAGTAFTNTAASALAIDTSNIHIGGSLNDASPLPLPGTLQEVIFYFANRTSTRAAIRDAINTHYAIY